MVPPMPTHCQARTGDATAPMVKALRGTGWNQSIRRFSAFHPEAVVKPFRGDGWAHFYDEYWSHQATVRSGDLEQEWFFYLPPSLKLETPLLMRTRITCLTPSQDKGSALEMWQRLRTRMELAFGSPNGIHSDIPAFGSGTWNDTVAWTTPRFCVVLYRSDNSVCLLAWNPMLMETSKAYEEAKYHAISRAREARTDSELEEAKKEVSAKGEPGLAELIPSGAEDPDCEQDGTRLKAATQLLEAIEYGQLAARNPALLGPVLYAAYLTLPSDLPLPGCYGHGPLQELEALRHLGAVYYESHCDCTLIKGDFLLRRLARDDAESIWGQRAFMRLVEDGFSPITCEEGSDTFRNVIEFVPAYLGCLRDPSLLKLATFELGRAYETWWSLAQAENDQYVDAGEHRTPGWEHSLGKALAMYAVVLKMDPTGAEAQMLQFRLPRLYLGIDTNCRDFYCIYD